MSGWIGVDLDGTLAAYTHWKGETHIGEPILPMVARVKDWLRQGREVKIFTARVTQGANNFDGTPHDVSTVIDAIERWCEQHIGCKLPITNVKDYGMIELWDDRAVQVVMNQGIPVGSSTQGL